MTIVQVDASDSFTCFAVVLPLAGVNVTAASIRHMDCCQVSGWNPWTHRQTLRWCSGSWVPPGAQHPERRNWYQWLAPRSLDLNPIDLLRDIVFPSIQCCQLKLSRISVIRSPSCPDMSDMHKSTRGLKFDQTRQTCLVSFHFDFWVVLNSAHSRFPFIPNTLPHIFLSSLLSVFGCLTPDCVGGVCRQRNKCTGRQRFGVL